MKKILCTTLLLILFPLNVYAISEQEQQDAINNQNILIQRDQQNFQEKIKEKDLQQVEKDQKEAEEQEEDYEELKEQEGKVIQDLRVLQCFRIKKIIFSENEIIEKIYEENFSKEYLGKCVSIRQISKLSKKVSDHLVDEGYVTSRAEIPAQSLAEGVLKINVIESYLENIAFNDENFFDRAQKFTAFGFVKKNKILNLILLFQICALTMNVM
jgi:hemolysin activation/secretion protein